MEAGRYPGESAPPSRFSFDTVVLDLARHEIWRDGELQSVEPRAMDVLAHLVANRSRVVPKTELLDTVWGDRFVADSALSSQIKAIRAVTGDDGKAQRVIRTVHGRGYQFVALVDDGLAEPAAVVARPPTRPVVEPPPVEMLGRDQLLTKIDSLLEPGSVVTLVGPAGVGKTSLARLVASIVGPRFDAGAFFVPLSTVEQGEPAGRALLDAMGRHRPPGTSDTAEAGRLLADLPALVVVDNCEHVLDDVVSLVGGKAGGGSAVLATSRQRLGVPGERVVDVPVLGADAAAALFVDRAAAAGVDLDPHDEAVLELCDELDRLPLALELASAHARVLGVEGLTALLDERFRVLERRAGDDSHHLTLHGAIASSFAALDDELADVLSRFTVFAGSFDLDAALAVATSESSSSTAVRQVIDLAERSLVVVEVSPQHTRYRLLESIRLFARERALDLTGARRAHAEHYREVAAAAAHLLDTPDYERGFETIETEWHNLRVAVRNALELGMVDDAMQILVSTVPVAELQMRIEHADWAQAVLDAAHGDEPFLPETRAALARLLVWQGELERASELVADVDPFHDDTPLVTIFSRFWVAANGRGDDAIDILEILRQRTQGSGGLSELEVTSMVNRTATYHGIDARAAEAHMRRLVPDDGCGIGRCFELHGEMHAAIRSGDTERATGLANELAKHANERGLTVLALGAFSARAVALQRHPDPRFVGDLARSALEQYAIHAHWISVPVDGELAARALLELGRPEVAAEILGACTELPFHGHGTVLAEETVARLRAELGPAFEPAFERGRVLPASALCRVAVEALDDVLG